MKILNVSNAGKWRKKRISPESKPLLLALRLDQKQLFRSCGKYQSPPKIEKVNPLHPFSQYAFLKPTHKSGRVIIWYVLEGKFFKKVKI